MAEYHDREHYIPIRRADLVEMLAKDKNTPGGERDAFRQFCKLITAIYHFQLHDELEQLKQQYAPFDPDSTAARPSNDDPEENDVHLSRLFDKFSWLMDKANFKRLSRDELQAATEAVSHWGLNMDLDFSVFEHLDVYVRGDGVGERYRRPWWKLWRLESTKVPVYQRLAVILKQKPHKRFGPSGNSDAVFIKLFKEIPKDDVEMLVPGGKLKMPKLERGKLGASLLGTVGFVGYKIFAEMGAIAQALVTQNPLLIWGPLSLVAGYGYKQWAGFQNSRQTYNLQLTQSLYYQTLDSNGGVFYHLLDEAEEQECREAILGWYYLWLFAGENGWTARDLDDYVEMDLERLADLKVDFEIEDALQKLLELRVVEATGDRYRAVPLDKALSLLDHRWDNYFQYNVEQNTTAGAN